MFNFLKNLWSYINPLNYFVPSYAFNQRVSGYNTALGWFFAPIAAGAGIYFLSRYLRGLPSYEVGASGGVHFPELLQERLRREATFTRAHEVPLPIDTLLTALAEVKALEEELNEERKDKKTKKEDEGDDKKEKTAAFWKKRAAFDPVTGLQVLFYAPARLFYATAVHPFLALGGVTSSVYSPMVWRHLGESAEKLRFKSRMQATEEEYVKALTDFIHATELISKKKYDMVWHNLDPGLKRIVIQKLRDYGFTDEQIEDFFNKFEENRKEATSLLRRRSYIVKFRNLLKKRAAVDRVISLVSLPLDLLAFYSFSPLLSAYKIYSLQPLLALSRPKIPLGPSETWEIIERHQDKFVPSEPLHYEAYLARLQEEIERELEKAVERTRRDKEKKTKTVVEEEEMPEWLDRYIKKRKNQEQEESETE